MRRRRREGGEEIRRSNGGEEMEEKRMRRRETRNRRGTRWNNTSPNHHGRVGHGATRFFKGFNFIYTACPFLHHVSSIGAGKIK